MYTQQELEQILKGIKQHKPISELESLLDRSAYGIIQKLQALSKADPGKWNPEIVAQYSKEYYNQSNKIRKKLYQRQYRAQHRDKIRKYHRQYKAQHRDETSSYFKGWYKQHNGKYKKSAEALRLKIDENHNGTLKELAERLKIHPASLNNYLLGNRMPQDDILKKMSMILEVPYKKLKGLYA